MTDRRRARIALIGPYGAGKTTLARALSRISGWPVPAVSPMANPVRGQVRPLEQCTLAQAFQLTLRRYGERTRSEVEAGHSFISDGSTLHEWIYLLTLARWTASRGGYQKGFEDPAARREQGAAIAHLAEHALDELIQQLGDRYDILVHVPVERSLPATSPISGDFQHLLEATTLQVLASWSVTSIVRAGGSLTARVRTVTEAVERQA